MLGWTDTNGVSVCRRPQSECSARWGSLHGCTHLGVTEPGCSHAAGPHLGAQFAQLVKELRSEYAAAVTSCAERIAGALFLRPGYSINTTLQRHGITGTPTVMQQQASRGAHRSAARPPAFPGCPGAAARLTGQPRQACQPDAGAFQTCCLWSTESCPRPALWSLVYCSTIPETAVLLWLCR